LANGYSIIAIKDIISTVKTFLNAKMKVFGQNQNLFVKKIKYLLIKSFIF